MKKQERTKEERMIKKVIKERGRERGMDRSITGPHKNEKEKRLG